MEGYKEDNVQFENLAIKLENQELRMIFPFIINPVKKARRINLK